MAAARRLRNEDVLSKQRLQKQVVELTEKLGSATREIEILTKALSTFCPTHLDETYLSLGNHHRDTQGHEETYLSQASSSGFVLPRDLSPLHVLVDSFILIDPV